MSKTTLSALAMTVLVLATVAPLGANVIEWQYVFEDASGLAARALFSLDLAQPNMLVIELANTSTALPVNFDSSDQILTGVSFDLAGRQIVAGAVHIGEWGRSLNFNHVAEPLGPGDEITGEWGYGNAGADGMMANFVSCRSARTTTFGGANLVGPATLGGPSGGLVPYMPLMELGGLGAVAGPALFTLTLDQPLESLEFLRSGATVQYGSNAAFITIPEPATAMLLVGLSVPLLLRCHRRRPGRHQLLKHP